MRAVTSGLRLGRLAKIIIIELMCNFVSQLNMKECELKGEAVPMEYFHRPIDTKKDEKPLKDCVIALSNYVGNERKFLQQLAENLGAVYQESLVKKTSSLKKCFSSTHLICEKPTGLKYSAAVRWNIPVVEAKWLLECWHTTKMVDVTPYLVVAAEETRNIEVMKSHLQTPTRTCPPVRLAAIQQRETPGSQTPLVNKHLGAIMNKTPQSPFHVRIPKTPYGTMLKNKFSSDTRKRGIECINNSSDLKESDLQPPLNRMKDKKNFEFDESEFKRPSVETTWKLLYIKDVKRKRVEMQTQRK